MVFVTLLALVLQQTPQQPSVEIPYKGLSYSMLSKNGVTVMVAPMNHRILEYATVEVWISNGSKYPIHVDPRFFEARTAADPASPAIAGAEDLKVIDEIGRRAKSKDLSELVRTYETTLYGFANEKSVSYYEKRKHAVLASGGKMRATATASAIILAEATLKAGETTDGTVFFATDPHSAIVSIGAHLAGSSYDFRIPGQ